jgi:hypothetical protein
MVATRSRARMPSASAWKLRTTRWTSTGAGQLANVVDGNRVAAVEDGARLGRQHEVLGRARARAPGHVLAHGLGRLRPGPGGAADGHGMREHVLGDGHAQNQVLQFDDAGRV